MEHILISTSISEETLETDNNNKYINYIVLNYGSIKYINPSELASFIFY